MNTTQVELVRYVYLDIVGFTRGRSVEAQADTVNTLNSIVQEMTKNLECDELIYLPTGDGMAICIVGRSAFDCHVDLALKLLSAIARHNESTKDGMRQFQIRVGINENSDNIVQDINGRRNVAGTGINMASRVMGLADEAQLLISSSVYEVLSTREAYLKCFRGYSASIKHGHAIRVYQYIKEQPFVSAAVPSALAKKTTPRLPLTPLEAYYVGFALKHRPFLIQNLIGQGEYSGILLLWFLACDAVGIAQQSETHPHRLRTHGEGKLPPEEAFEYYQSLDFWLVVEFSQHIIKRFAHLSSFFVDQGVVTWHIANKDATTALWKERPEVAEGLGLENPDSA